MSPPDRRAALKMLGLGTLAGTAPNLLAQSTALTRIAFGSCLHQDKPQPIWDAVIASKAELFVFLGDNIYGDSDDPAVLAAQYRKLAAVPGFQRLRETTDVMAIWDDHDYGRNDAGVEYPAKQASRELFLDFWREPRESLRRTRPDGIYTARIFGTAGRRVQLLMPDLRWNREPLAMVQGDSAYAARDAANMGPYIADPSERAQLLGEAQWRWLEQELSKPAEVRIFASSIQVLANFTGWETWANFPAEQRRLLKLLDAASDSVNVLISGDVHWCEYSVQPSARGAQPHAELTSSGLTETWEKISPNIYRTGEAFAVQNFGLIDIDWTAARPRLQLTVRDQASATLIEGFHPA